MKYNWQTTNHTYFNTILSNLCLVYENIYLKEFINI